MSSSRLSAGWTRCGLRRGTASDLSTCCDTQSGRRLRSRGYTERAALQRSSRTSGCRAFKLRSGTTAPHRPDDPRPTSARQPAAARLVSRAPCPDPLPQHVPRPHHEPLLVAWSSFTSRSPPSRIVRRPPRRPNLRRLVRLQARAAARANQTQHPLDRLRRRDHRQQPPRAPAVRAHQHLHLEHPPQQLRPRVAAHHNSPAPAMPRRVRDRLPTPAQRIDRRGASSPLSGRARLSLGLGLLTPTRHNPRTYSL